MHMLSRRKPQAALAAVTAALAVAVPAASAGAQATPNPNIDPTVCQLFNAQMGPYGLTRYPGGASLAGVLTNAGSTVGCTVSAPAQPQVPTAP